MSQHAVACSGISRSFGATKAVSHVDFTLAPGEVLALVGENGAGKSTLMNMLSGSLTPDTGQVTIAEPQGELARSVAMVHQELSLFDNLTVAENFALDGERRDGGEAAARAFARQTMADLGTDIDVDATVGELSVGQRQLVEIAKAIAIAPVLLILDEPTSSLEGPQVDLLFAAVRRLTRAGTAVLFVSHRMEELFQLCDQVLVMRDGTQVDFGDLASRTRNDLVEAMVGREASTLYPPRPPTPDSADAPAIALTDVSLAGTLESVSIDFPAGQITAIAGLEGHGQADIARVLAGARRPDGGAVLRAGRPVRYRSPKAAVADGVGYIAPDRRLEGLLGDQSITANTMLAAGRRIFGNGIIRPRRQREVVSGVVQTLAVKCASLLQPILELSGGNQQKVLIGRWLIDDGLNVLVLDDPTRGVDVGSRAQIYRVIRELADRGVAIALVSTDLQEILGLADSIHVIYSGRITGQLDAETATEADVMRLATGGVAHV
ncbi:MAG: sugar ABC transporter ATP-binding protein [Beutenbergiaceae bacterium]